jgi:hypothetical protein
VLFLGVGSVGSRVKGGEVENLHFVVGGDEEFASHFGGLVCLFC